MRDGEGIANISDREYDRKYQEEAEDTLDQLPQTPQSTLPRKKNEKLIRQNKLSVSVPTVYQPPTKASPGKNPETVSSCTIFSLDSCIYL